MGSHGRTGHGLTRRVGIVACGRAASAVSVLAVIAILSRTWTPGEFGFFSAAWALGNTLVPIFLVGLPTSLLYFFGQVGPSGQRHLVWRAALALGTSGGLLALLLALVAPQLASMLHVFGVETDAAGVDWAPLLYPFIPYFFSLVAAGFAESSLVAAGRPTWQAALALATAVGVITAAAAGAVFAGTVSQVAAAFSAVGLARMVAAYIMVARVLAQGRVVDAPGDRGARGRASLRELLSYSLPIAMNDTVGSLSRSVDRLVIVAFLFTGERFGLYHAGAVEVPISLLLAAVVTVVIPEVSRLYREGDTDQIASLWKHAVSRLSLMTIPLFFLLFAHAESIIALYLPEDFARAEWVFRIFLLVLPLRCAIYNPLLVGMGKASWALWGGLGDLVCNVTLSIVLVQLLLASMPEWAILGPAAATVFSTYLQVAVLVMLIGRHLRWGMLDLMPWSQLLRTGLFSIVAAAVSLVLSHSLEQPAAKLVVGTAAFGTVLAAASWLHAGQREEIRRLMAALRRPSVEGDE